MIGRLHNLTFTRDGEGLLTFRTREDMTDLYDDLKDKDVTVTVKKFNPKRGLSANAMYWAYIGELAKVLGESNAALHNIMIRKYGFPETYEGQVVYTMIPDTEEAERKALEAETYHLKPTSQVKEGKDGNNYRAYLLMRGSSTYDTSEFSRLLDGLIQDCIEAGMHIQTERGEYD